MKHFFALVLSVMTVHGFAQSGITYNDFIQQDNKITWAAEYEQLFDITPTVKKAGIKESLYMQLQKKGCIDNYRVVKDSLLSKTTFCNTDNEVIDSFTTNINPFRNYLHHINNESKFTKNEEKCSCTGAYQKSKFDIYKIKQIVYYRNARLKIRNILVTPVCLKRIIDSDHDQQFVWKDVYTSCFDNNEHTIITPELKRVWIDLGSSETPYNFSYDSTNDSTLNAKVYTKKEPILSQHIYQDIISGRITVVDIPTGKVIPGNTVLDYGIRPVVTPKYDSTGEIVGQTTTLPVANIDSFYHFNINQHFYFDTVNNILHSQVNYVDVVKNVYNKRGIYVGTTPFYRIFFIVPILYTKPINNKFLQPSYD